MSFNIVVSGFLTPVRRSAPITPCRPGVEMTPQAIFDPSGRAVTNSISDSFGAIEQRVVDEKSLTFDEVKAAVAANFTLFR